MRLAAQTDSPRRALRWALAVCVPVLAGCHLDMWNQARYEPLESSTFFEDGLSSRPLVEGTVAYGAAGTDEHYHAGKAGGGYAAELPARIASDGDWDWSDPAKRRALLLRGQERFMIYCSPCHGILGDGNGMITRRGFPNPPSYSEPRLLEANLGYFVDVMTNGFGRMYSYAARVPIEDRWAIASYIRVLQLSQHATPDLIPAEMVDAALAASEQAATPGDPAGEAAREH